MPDQKLYYLCRLISSETDPNKLTDAIDGLIKLLSEEQDDIKIRIRQNIGRSPNPPE